VGRVIEDEPSLDAMHRGDISAPKNFCIGFFLRCTLVLPRMAFVVEEFPLPRTFKSRWGSMNS
jgi:hypothetical protein